MTALKFAGLPKKRILVNVLKFRTLCFVHFWPKFCFLCNCFLKYLMEWQTVKTLIGMANSEDPDQAAQEQSDQGLHCLCISICQKL